MIGDIGERGRIMQALRRSEELGAEIIRSALDCVVTFDEQGRVLEFNPAAENTFGYKRTEAIGREVGELMIPPALRNAHRERLATAVSGRGDNSVLNRRRELIAMRSDGTEFPIELTITRVQDEPLRFAAFMRDLTERRDAKQELALSHAGLAEAQALAHVGSWDWDIPSGRVVWSQELLRMFGLPPDDVEQSYEAFRSRVHAEDRDRVDRTVTIALAARVPFTYECRIVTADDQVRVIEVHSDLELGPDGEVVRLHGTSQDVSVRKHGELALGESRSRLQAIVDGSEAAIYVKDRSLRYRIVNKKCEELFHLLATQQADGAPEPIFRSDAIEPIRRHDQQVLDTGESLQVEENITVDGVTRTYLIHLFPLRDAGREVEAICGVATDITTQARAQEELLRRADRQAAVARLGGDAIADTRLADLFDLATDVLRRMLAVDYAKVLELSADGKDLVLRSAVGIDPDLVGTATVPATAETHAGFSLTTAGPVVLEDLEHDTRFRNAAFLNGRPVVSGVSARIEGKEGVFGAITAHTSHRRLFSEDEVHFVQAVANVLGGAITRDRAKHLEQQLQQSQRLEAVGQLAGGIAHDFNNLLAVILNYAVFATESLAEGDPAREDLGEVEKAARRASDLTKQLLVFSRRQLIDPEPQDVNVLVTEIESLLGRTLGEHIELIVERGAEAAVVVMESGQLDHVLVNLAVNARDAMPEGGRLFISTSNVEFEDDVEQGDFAIAAGAYLRLAVVDSGSGMPPDVIGKAFDPFFTTKPSGKGTGLGLASVYGSVKQAGGYINLSSEPECGTAVTIYLPVSQRAATPSPELLDAKALCGTGETILLVEDEDAVRRLAHKILTENGYRVVAACDGASALAALAKEPDRPIDVLLTDVVMPQMSGRELAKRLMAQDPGLRLLYMSGYPHEILTHRGMLDEDAASLLEKPFSAAQLLAKLRKVLAS